MFTPELNTAAPPSPRPLRRIGALPESVLRFRADLEQPAVWTGPDTATPSTPPASGGIAVDLRGLGKSYGARRVLSDIDLHLTPGEFVAIVGRSGCGKSTLLRLIAGLEPASQGRITFDGAPLAGHRDDVRLMFQDARLLPWKRVIDNIVLGVGPEDASGVAAPKGAGWLGATRRQPPRDAHDRAREALAQVGLADRAHDWPAALSGGQRQRVALARALVHAPRLLLLDEPLGALDALTRIEMQRLIEQLWQRHGFSAVLVTHDVSEAVALADRVILIEDQRIGLDDPIPLSRPRHRSQSAFGEIEERVLTRVLSRPDAA